MEQKSNEFFVDLNTLSKTVDKKLEDFALNEELNVDDIIKIIYKEAERIGQKDKVKVTFETLEDDSFRVKVETIKTMYKGTVIYPFEKIKSESREIILDEVFGKLTLYNKKDISSQLTVTIDGVALDLFAMSYSKAKELLINISNRKEENSYIEQENSISFKKYGVKLNCKKDADEINSIDVYNEEEFFNEFEFSKEKYDVDISKIGTSYSYEIPEFNVDELDKNKEKEQFDIEIEIPNDNTSVERKEKILEDKLYEKLKKFSIDTYEQKEQLKEEVESIDENLNVELKNEIEELTDLYEKQKEQQRILENRINTKLQELKTLYESNSASKIKLVKNTVEDVEKAVEINKKVDVVKQQDNGKKSYVIESYKGIKEQGENKLAVFLGETKDDIRNYFKIVPKEAKDYEDMEIYDNFYAYYDDEDKCTGIGIYNQDDCKDKFSLYLFGKDLITMPYKEIVKLIKDHDYKAIEDEDGIISLEYGISVDPKDDKEYKESICDVIHLFEKGYYDEVYNM